MSRLIRAQPFSPTSLYGQEKAKMDGQREIGKGGMLLEKEGEMIRVKCRHCLVDTDHKERPQRAGSVASLWFVMVQGNIPFLPKEWQ